MSDSVVCPEVRATTRKQWTTFVLDMSDLPSSETLSSISGTDSQGVARGVTDATGTLTIGSSGGSAPAINGSALTVDGKTIAVGKAVQFWLGASGGAVGSVYTIDVVVTTSAGRTLHRKCRVLVEA